MVDTERRWDLDALRGLMLVLMAVTHFPTVLSDPLGQPFGFVSAAEGFVLLSAFMAGMVYSARARQDGGEAMRDAFFQRALKIYACQAVLLVFAFTVIAAIGLLGRQPAVTDLLGFFIDQPLKALLGSLLLLYNPSLLDILPLYILFMLASPVLLLHGMRQGWGGILAISTGLWLATQFGLGPALFGLADRAIGMPVRYGDMGAFEIFGWQFLWVLGLWLGSETGRPSVAPLVFPRWMVHSAVVVAATCFVWRHAVGQTPFPGMASLAPLFDKWHLGPLRLINFLALLLLVMHFGPWLKRRLPRVAALETLGQQSLPVFCAHLVVALLALALFGAHQPGRPLSVDLLILFAGFASLYLVASASRAVDERTARLRAALKARQARRLSARDARRSPPATAHTPPG